MYPKPTINAKTKKNYSKTKKNTVHIYLKLI